MVKQVGIVDFLTEEEIARAGELGKAVDIEREIIRPNIDRINAALGQENDPMYLAYAVEYVLSKINSRTD